MTLVMIVKSQDSNKRYLGKGEIAVSDAERIESKKMRETTKSL